MRQAEFEFLREPVERDRAPGVPMPIGPVAPLSVSTFSTSPAMAASVA